MQARKHLFFDGPLAAGQEVTAPAGLARRLCRVLRLRTGAEVALFNGRDGLFAARLLSDKGDRLAVTARLAPLPDRPKVVLLLAVLKRDAMDRALRQATELGVTTVQPLLTAHCVPDRLNLERAGAVVVEAAEQCERVDLPELPAPMPLEAAVAGFAGEILWARARAADKDSSECGWFGWSGAPVWPGSGLLIGPEGGFSDAECGLLAAADRVRPVGLGATILRADTAVVAGVSVLQQALRAEQG